MKRLFFTILVIIAVSCTERIDIKIDDAPSRVVIYGYITSDTMRHSIQITRSAGYFSTDSPEGISNAIVTISDDDGNVIPLVECDTVRGLYQTAPDVYGEEGKTYTLDVLLNSGEHYQATAFLHNINIEIDSIGLQISPIRNNIVEVLLYAQNLDTQNYYSFFIAVNDSVVNSTIDRFIVIGNTAIFGEQITGLAVYRLNQDKEKLNIGDKVTVCVNAIPQEYATFVSNVQTEIRGSVPFFGGPPANVPTNIKSVNGAVPALGFFTAYSSRYACTIVEEDFTPKK